MRGNNNFSIRVVELNDKDLELERQLQTKYKNDISQDAIIEQVKILSDDDIL